MATATTGCAPTRPAPRVRRSGSRPPSPSTMACASTTSAGASGVGERRATLDAARSVLYFHEGATAGPAVITGGDGSLVEERRFEPFGQPIEANLAAVPHNNLNRPVDATTGWSFHGARWM